MPARGMASTAACSVRRISATNCASSRCSAFQVSAGRCAELAVERGEHVVQQAAAAAVIGFQHQVAERFELEHLLGR